jgi:hypothetical protein
VKKQYQEKLNNVYQNTYPKNVVPVPGETYDKLTERIARDTIDRMTGSFMKWLRENGDHTTTEWSIRECLTQIARDYDRQNNRLEGV